MRNLKKFLYTSEYDFYMNGDYVELPNLSYIEEILGVKYNPILSREAYFSIPKEAEEILPYSISIPNAIKSFKVNNVEYVKSTDSVNTINVEGGIFVDDVLNFITQHPEYHMVADAFSSIILTIPDFNPTTEDIILIQYIEFGENFLCEAYPGSLIFLDLLNSVSENKYEINELFFMEINHMLAEYAQLGYLVKFYLTAIESGYTSNEDTTLASFTTKPTIIEYKTSVDKFIFNEVGNYTAEIEFHDKNIPSLNFMGWPVISFNDIFFKGLSINNALGLFYACYLIESINIENLDTSLTTNTSYMFNECGELKTIKGIEKLNVGNVTNMGWMFQGSHSLKSVDLSGWNISNVTDMSYMFSGCTGLTSVKMGGDISNVTNVEDMFASVETLGNFYYNSAYDYSIILAELPETWTAIPCTLVDDKLIPNIEREIYLSIPESAAEELPYTITLTKHFKSFKVNGVEYAQENEENINTITINQSGYINDLMSFLLGNEEYAMTEDSYSSIKINVPDANFENGDEVLIVLLFDINGEVMYEMAPCIEAGLGFLKADNIVEFNNNSISAINQYIMEIQSQGGNMSVYAFGIGSDFTLDEDGYNITSFTLKPTTIEYEGGNFGLWVIDEVGDYTAQVEFKNTDITGVSFYGWPVVGFSDEFFTGLTTRDASLMFFQTALLTDIDLNGLITSDTVNTLGMFFSNDGLNRINGIETWDVSNVTNMSNMFFYCYGLTSLDLSNWNTSNVTNMNSMFYGCAGLTSLDLSNWNTSNVTNMNGMFYACESLTSLDLSNWNTSNVTDMSHMFGVCDYLTEIKMGGDVSNVTNVENMFLFNYSNGTFYYNSAYDYSLILAQLPSRWTTVPCIMINGELVPISN